MHQQLSIAVKTPGDIRPVRKVTVCAGTACRANGALKVYAAFVAAIQKAGFEVAESFVETQAKQDLSNTYRTSKSGCQGFCQMGPLVTVEP